jgi:hypothetical protein
MPDLRIENAVKLDEPCKNLIHFLKKKNSVIFFSWVARLDRDPLKIYHLAFKMFLSNL